MKKLSLLMLAASLFTASCENAPKADSAQTGEAQDVATTGDMTYQADLSQSTVTWVGTKPVGKHNGSFAISSGNILTTGGNVSGGEFTIDMKSLKALDQDSAGNAKLAGHLSGADFFDVAKYPTAKFVVTSVSSGVDTANKDLIMKDATHTVTGNLTLKDSTKSITFPAKIALTESNATVDANFNIDRTMWGVSYGNDKSLGDKFINPTVNIGVHVVANK